ncbi:hypothetical protein HDV00_011533 [Rhizophlyctis rosea]|nr:hypothetical protein HDV00_011533 [Rhizophlyctis rosea]
MPPSIESMISSPVLAQREILLDESPAADAGSIVHTFLYSNRSGSVNPSDYLTPIADPVQPLDVEVPDAPPPDPSTLNDFQKYVVAMLTKHDSRMGRIREGISLVSEHRNVDQIVTTFERVFGVPLQYGRKMRLGGMIYGYEDHVTSFQQLFTYLQHVFWDQNLVKLSKTPNELSARWILFSLQDDEHSQTNIISPVGSQADLNIIQPSARMAWKRELTELTDVCESNSQQPSTTPHIHRILLADSTLLPLPHNTAQATQASPAVFTACARVKDL